MRTITWIVCSLAALSASAYGDSFSFLSRRKKIDPPPEEEASRAQSDGEASLLELGDADEGEAVTSSSSDGQEVTNVMQEVNSTNADSGESLLGKLASAIGLSQEPKKEEAKKEEADQTVSSEVATEPEKADQTVSPEVSTEPEKVKPEKEVEPEKEVASATKNSAIEQEVSKPEEQHVQSAGELGGIHLEGAAPKAEEQIKPAENKVADNKVETSVPSSAPEVKAAAPPSSAAEVKPEVKPEGTASTSSTEVKKDNAAAPDGTMGGVKAESLVSASTTDLKSEISAAPTGEVKNETTPTQEVILEGHQAVGEEKSVVTSEAAVKAEAPPAASPEVGTYVPEAVGTEKSLESTVNLEQNPAVTQAVPGLEPVPQPIVPPANVIAANDTQLHNSPALQTNSTGTVKSERDSTGTVKLEGTGEVKTETPHEVKVESPSSNANPESMPAEVSSEIKPESAAEVKPESAAEVKPESMAEASGQVRAELPTQESMPSEVTGEVKTETGGVVKAEAELGGVHTEGSPAVTQDNLNLKQPSGNNQEDLEEADAGFDGVEELPARYSEVPTEATHSDAVGKEVGSTKVHVVADLHKQVGYINF